MPPYLCGTGMRKRLSSTRTRTRMGGSKDGPCWVGAGRNRLSQKTQPSTLTAPAAPT